MTDNYGFGFDLENGYCCKTNGFHSLDFVADMNFGFDNEVQSYWSRSEETVV